MERLFFAGSDVLVLHDDDALVLAEALDDAAYGAWMAGNEDRKERLLVMARVFEDEPEP